MIEKWTENAQPMRWVHIIVLHQHFLLEAKRQNYKHFHLQGTMESARYDFCFGLAVVESGTVSPQVCLEVSTGE